MSIENYMAVTLNKSQVKEMRSKARKTGFDRAIHLTRLFVTGDTKTREGIKELNHQDTDVMILLEEIQLLEGELQ